MSTIAERMAEAVLLVDGLPVKPPEDWKIDTGKFIVTVERVPGTRGHTFKAARFIADKAGRTIVATSESYWTSVDAMAGAMREADRRAFVLAAVSDCLDEDGWEIDPMIAGCDHGITAFRNGVKARIYGDGTVTADAPCGRLRLPPLWARFVGDIFRRYGRPPRCWWVRRLT